MTPGSHFRIDGNTLTVSGELCYEDEKTLEKALHQLSRAGVAPLVVDLSDVRFMASSCIRYVVEAAIDAKKAGRDTRVVAGGQVLRLIHTVQLDRFAEIQTSRDPRLP